MNMPALTSMTGATFIILLLMYISIRYFIYQHPEYEGLFRRIEMMLITLIIIALILGNWFITSHH